MIQMEQAHSFRANAENDKNFAEALANAINHNVTVVTLRCNVTEDSLNIYSAENIFNFK